MERFFDNIKEGQILVTVNGGQFVAVDPHRNTDEPDNPFIVYDDKGNSYFEEDIDVRKSLALMDPDHEPDAYYLFQVSHSTGSNSCTGCFNLYNGQWRNME